MAKYKKTFRKQCDLETEIYNSIVICPHLCFTSWCSQTQGTVFKFCCSSALISSFSSTAKSCCVVFKQQYFMIFQQMHAFSCILWCDFSLIDILFLVLRQHQCSNASAATSNGNKNGYLHISGNRIFVASWFLLLVYHCESDPCITTQADDKLLIHSDD